MILSFFHQNNRYDPRIVEDVDENGMTPFMRALEAGDSDLIRACFAENLDLYLGDKSKYGPLMIAASKVHLAAMKLIYDRDPLTFNERTLNSQPLLFWIFFCR